MALMAQTKNKLDPFTCLSVVQKAVRRGDETLAVHYAFELAFSSPAYRTMVLNYLQQVILYEDVGPFDPVAAVYAAVAFKTAQDAAKRTDANDPNKARWSLPLISGIVACCRLKKSRVAAHIWAVVTAESLPPVPTDGPLPPVPDYAHDMHTHKGKKLGRGIDHFLDNLVLRPESDEYDPYKDEALSIWRTTQSERIAEKEHAAAKAEKAPAKPKPPADAVKKQPALFKTHEPGVQTT